jgi:hypothetical protein
MRLEARKDCRMGAREAAPTRLGLVAILKRRELQAEDA